jgi:hypothetical protein
MTDEPKFTETFAKYVCMGDRIETTIGGLRAVATLYQDDCQDTPWQRDCGHGPVSDWRSKESKRPGERVLCEDRAKARFYDFAAACDMARRDGWGVEGGRRPDETAKQYAARAVERDFAVLKAWCDDEWSYCGVAVQIFADETPLTGEYDHALWGIEYNYPVSDNAYLTDVANEYLGEALKAARARLAELAALAGETAP